MSEAVRQQKEGLDELRKLRLVVVRLKRLLQEHETYAPAALEESADTIMGELSYHARRVSGALRVLVSIRNRRLHGIGQE